MFLLLLLLLLLPITMAHICPIYTTTRTAHNATTARQLDRHVTAFLSPLGPRNTPPTNFPTGHRHITWDTDEPFSTDGNFSSKGLILHTKLSKLLHSNAADRPDNRFSTIIRPVISRSLKPFSLPRLITPAKSNKLSATFTIPGTHIRAAVSSFAAVFVDVDQMRSSWIWLKDSDGCTITRLEVPVSANGLSFVGVSMRDSNRPVIAQVLIKLGTATIADFRKRTPCLDFTGDLVVLDDIFFSEPKNIIPSRH